MIQIKKGVDRVGLPNGECMDQHHQHHLGVVGTADIWHHSSPALSEFLGMEFSNLPVIIIPLKVWKPWARGFGNISWPRD